MPPSPSKHQQQLAKWSVFGKSLESEERRRVSENLVSRTASIQKRKDRYVKRLNYRSEASVGTRIHKPTRALYLMGVWQSLTPTQSSAYAFSHVGSNGSSVDQYCGEGKAVDDVEGCVAIVRSLLYIHLTIHVKCLFKFDVLGRKIYKYTKWGSTGPTKSNNGSSLSQSDRQVLAESLQGSLIVKGEAQKEEYDDVIKRWNEVYIMQAVSPSPSPFPNSRSIQLPSIDFCLR